MHRFIGQFIPWSSLFFLMILGVATTAQPVKNKPGSGRLTLGMRSTISTFNQGNFSHNGMGVGGHFRLRFSEKINTEWFADYITNNIADQAKRMDGHIGWSVFYYPFRDSAETSLFQPYALAGHCFDYTKVSALYEEKSAQRWSSAVQTGLGTHFRLTDRVDVSLTGQYMIHLGNDIHTEVQGESVVIEEHQGANLESHILWSISVNYKLVELW